MKEIISNLFGFLYTLSMGDYIFFALTFILILLFIYVMFLMKKEDFVSDNESLESIVNNIEENYKPGNITLTEYESEQEKNAIISYEELIKSKDKLNISYDEEYISDTEEISIKKINLNNTETRVNNDSKLNVRLMSYDKEEAFLIALKQLQQNLIN